MENKNTASKYAKEHGMKSLKEVVELTDVSEQTLINWFYNPKKRKLFEMLIFGCEAYKRVER